jgi:hypothetical protein
MSSQNIPLKGRTDLRGSSRILATETSRVLSCGIEDTQLGPSAAGIVSKRFAPPLAIERHGCKARIGPRFLPIQRCSGGGQTSNTIAHFALDFERKESVCGDDGHRA